MRKVYSLLTVMIMALVMSFTSKAASVTINVDDPNRVSVQVNYVEQALVAGDNTFDLTVGTYTSIYISAKEGAMLKSVVNESGTPQSIYSGMAGIYAYPTDDSFAEKYYVTSVSLAEARTATCTINVDKAENIGGLQMNSTNERIVLVDGENIVKFIPDMESPFSLSCPYGQTFYKVVVDGVEVTESWGSWYLYVNDGSVVDIQTEFPDVEVAVNVAFATEEAKGVLTGIAVDGETVALDENGNLNVKIGKEVTLFLDNTNYSIDEFTLNGQTPNDWYGYSSEYTFVVKDATNIALNAHKYGTLKVTINVEHPECVILKDYNGNVLNLVAGDNEIEVSENAASLSIVKAAGCKITSVLVNGSEASNYGYDSSYGTTINILSDNTTIVIVANEIVYDNTAYIEIDDECYSYSYVMNAVTRDQIYLTKGKTKVGFNNGEESHRINVMTKNYSAPAAIYHNGLFLTNYSSATITLADGDIIKVFMNEDPACNVTFSVEEGVEAIQSVAVEGKEYATWADGLTVCEGTNVSVTMPEGFAGVVVVNGSVVKGTNGVYTFEVSEATSVVVEAAAPAVNVVTPTAGGSANPFAYDLKSEFVGGALKASFSLNAEATAVTLKVRNAAGDVIATAEGATNKGAQTISVNLVEFDGENCTWEVEVAGAEKTTIEEFAKPMFYHPRGVDVDNNMESPAFGYVYVTEGMNSSKSQYWACDANGGLGLYIFTPDMEGVKNPTTGLYSFKGGWTLNYKAGSASAADFARVRVAEDGRIFVTRMQDDGDYILVAENHETLVATDKMESLFAGLTFDASTYKYTNAEGAFMGAANLGFDVKGAGENLKLLALSSNVNHWSYVYSGASTDEYALGTAAILPVPTNVPALTGKYTIAPAATNVDYDNEGGIWYCQYRGTPTDAQPGLVYVNAEGKEVYKDLVSRGGGGVRVSPDGTQLAAASSSANPKQFSIYDIKHYENGYVRLVEKTKITHGIGTNVYDIAWDLAGNIYICGNSGEYMKGFALPRSEAFTTKAATKYAFTVVVPKNYEDVVADELPEVQLESSYYMNEANSAEIAELAEKTVRRSIVKGDYMYVLAVDAEKAPYVYVINVNDNTVAEVSTEGIVAPANANGLAISDIALTADNYLEATSYDWITYNGEAYNYIYAWEKDDNNLPTGKATVWAKSNGAAHTANAMVGSSIAFSGLLNEGTAMVTVNDLLGGELSGSMHFVRYTKAAGEMVVENANQGGATQGYGNLNTKHHEIYGDEYKLTVSPNNDNNFILDGNLAGATELSYQGVKAGSDLVEVAADAVAAKGAVNSSYFKYAGSALLAAPVVVDGVCAGVQLINVTEGLDKAVEVKISIAEIAGNVTASDVHVSGRSYVEEEEGKIDLFLLIGNKLVKYTSGTPEEEAPANYKDDVAEQLPEVELGAEHKMKEVGTTEFAELAGKTVRRAIVKGDNMYVLALDAEKAPYIYVVNVNDNTVTEVSTEGAVAPTDANGLMISDIAISADNHLVATSYDWVPFNSTVYNYVYVWEKDYDNLPVGNPTEWAKSNGAARCSNGMVGSSIAFTGTLNDGTAIVAVNHLSSGAISGKMRFIRYTKVAGEMVIEDANQGGATQGYGNLNTIYHTIYGAEHKFTVSPVNEANFIFDGNVAGATEFCYDGIATSQDFTVVAADAVAAKEVVNSSYFKYAGSALMAAPAVENGACVGIQMINVTEGLDKAAEVKTSLPAMAGNTIALSEIHAAGRSYVDGTEGKIDLFLLIGNKLVKYTTGEGSSSIDEIGEDNLPVEYYNLQGVKVVNPEKGIFIKKQGNKATKVVL